MMIGRFGSQLEGALANLEGAYSAGDWAQLKAESHSLKGSAKFMSAAPLCAAATKVQELSADGSGGGDPRFVPPAHELAAAMGELRAAATAVHGFLRERPAEAGRGGRSGGGGGGGGAETQEGKGRGSGRSGG